MKHYGVLMMAKIFLHSSVSSLNPDFSSANPKFSSCVRHTCGQTLKTMEGRCLKINNIVFASWNSPLCIVSFSAIQRRKISMNIKYQIIAPITSKSSCAESEISGFESISPHFLSQKLSRHTLLTPHALNIAVANT